MSARISIFAYGSNMCLERIQARTPSASLVTVGHLRGYQFRFHKRGLDDSTKADAWHTGDGDDRVWGVVFELDRAEKPILDRAESLGIGYDLQEVRVEDVQGGTLSAGIYIARPDVISLRLKPYTWYKRFVVTGARQHQLPDNYTQFLEAFDAIPDPDPHRHRLNWSLVEG